MEYVNLPTSAKLRVLAQPDIVKEWSGYNPNTYFFSVFLKGIFTDIYMGVVANAKSQLGTLGPLASFIIDDPMAFLGDAFRHIEPGEIFPEEYTDVNAADESLAPVSGHHLNIITETDRTIEKWQVRISHNRDTFATFFKDFSSFQQFMKILEGNMTKGIQKALKVIFSAVMNTDTSLTTIDNREIARIFGAALSQPPTPSPINNENEIKWPTSSALGLKYNKMMWKLINKYAGKAVELWKNVQWYNPYYFSFDDYHEEMDRTSIFAPPKLGKDRSKQLAQDLYTDAHQTESHDGRTQHNHETTFHPHSLHRNDSLFALFDAISKACVTITTEESSEYWLGSDTTKTYAGISKKEQTAIKQHMQSAAMAQEQDRTPLRFENPNTSSSFAEGFEVCASSEDLVLLLNPHDYMDLKIGIARRGQMDTRAVNLEMLKEYVKNIFPLRGMKPGFARLIDKRAFSIRPYFQMTDVQTPMEKLTWRYKVFYQFAVVMFKNFAGCMFVPSPHFVASSRFYDKFSLIGQPIEKG